MKMFRRGSGDFLDIFYPQNMMFLHWLMGFIFNTVTRNNKGYVKLMFLGVARGGYPPLELSEAHNFKI